jgi:hypothetical protein
MALKDMKRTKVDQKASKEKYNTACDPMGVDEYPWSLRLTLNDEELKKLGISSLPKVGGKMSLSAEVSVIATRQADRSNGGTERSLELQITRMELSGKSAGFRARRCAARDRRSRVILLWSPRPISGRGDLNDSS